MSEAFYRDLPPIGRFEDVVDLGAYRQAPDDWLVVLTDVRGSTKAIEAGRYKDVNALGVASIVAVRNAVPDVDLPFVFGGDGATLLCPAARREPVERALRGVRATARVAFDLELRVGIVPVAELRADGQALLVARHQASPHVALAMFGGGALVEAERRLKDPALAERYLVDSSGPGDADLSGFECRWNPVPSGAGQFVSLLIHATPSDPDEAADVYREALRAVQETVGADARPVEPGRLSLAGGGRAFEQEARLKSRAATGIKLYLFRLFIRIVAFIGRTLLRSKRKLADFDGARYADEVVANTDYRKFDDTLRMVIDASPEALAALRGRLEAAHAAGRLHYGIHTSDTAMLTCIIGGYEQDHLHFVDGGDGGYALAAQQMKRQARADFE